MNKNFAVIAGLCVFFAGSAFAQKNLIKSVQRGVEQARFVQKTSLSSVVNGYLRTPGVTHFTLPSTGEALRAVRFSRNIAAKKEGLLIPEGSLAVVNAEGKIALFRPDEAVPAEIEEGMQEAFYAEHPGLKEFEDAIRAGMEADEAVLSKPWNGKTAYDGQEDLAQDINAYYQGADETFGQVEIFGQQAIVYRVPVWNIYYHPAGRAGRYLNPEQDLILFYPDINDGQIVFDGVKDPFFGLQD